MIPVFRLLSKLAKDRKINKREYEIAVDDGNEGPLFYYGMEDVVINEADSETFTFIDEDDNFIKIPYSNIKKILQNEKPVWVREAMRQ